jgi:hypothetical protein
MLKDLKKELYKVKSLLGHKGKPNLFVCVTPLHIAFWSKQQRVIKILLDFMSLIERKNHNVFLDVLPFMIEQEGFSDFFGSFAF